eukprot:RCo050945
MRRFVALRMSAGQGFPLSMVDARGRALTLAAAPKRVISLVPSLTELLADLGLDDAVVGVTRYCIHPTGWNTRKGVVGGTKDVKPNRVAALTPDLVVANLEENTKAGVEALDSLCPVYVTDVATVEQALSTITAVGALVGKPNESELLCQRIRDGFGSLHSCSPPKSAAYLIWRRPYMTIGSDTFIHDVMSRAGLANVFHHHRRYPQVTEEDLARACPEVVLLSSEPYPFKEKHREEMQRVVPQAKVVLVDGTFFSWYGSRMQNAPSYLAQLLQQLNA